VSDLVSSLTDGRYLDQKCRLKSTKIPSCLYFIEGESFAVPMQLRKITPQHVRTSLVTSYLEHEIHVVRTRDLDHTIAMLQHITA
jgi:ERCC4-type nuclease